LFLNNLCSQSLNVSIDQVHEIKELSVDVNIKTIAKDSCNQVWLGADNGLYRFDGKNVKRFDFKFVKTIKKLQNQRIAVLTDSGLFEITTLPYSCKIDTILLTAKKITDESLYYPKSLYEDKYGTLWIGEDKDIVRYKNGQIKRFKFKEIDSSDFLHRAYNFVEDGFGQLWAIAFSGELLRYDFEKDTFIIVKSGLWNEISSSIALGDDKIWLGTKNGVHEVKINSKGEFVSSAQIVKIPNVSKIEITNDIALVSTWENGMYKIDLQGNSQKINSLRYSQIFDFFIDDKSVWIATRENILMLYLSPIELIFETENKYIPSVKLLKDSRLIINSGDKIYLTTQSYKGLSQQLIFDAKQQFWANDATLVQGILWMTTSKGVYNYDLEKQQLTQTLAVKKNDWNDKIYADSKNIIWISGKTETPVLSIKNNQVKSWKELNNCLTITENNTGVLFAAGENGNIFRQEDNNFEKIEIEFPNKQKPTIHTIKFLKDSLYLGTNQGLWTINTNRLSTSQARLIHTGDVSSLVIDKYNNLWFGHTKGLSLLKENSLYHFNRSSGLPSKYIVSQGLSIDANNQIWISTSKGVAKANIDKLTQEQTPKPYIYSLYVQNKNTSITGFNLGIFNTNTTIALGFTALIFPKDNILYESFLYHNDELQERKKSQGLLSFLELKSGKYILKIRAKQENLKWSKAITYTFTIKNSWYQTPWFYALSIILMIGLIVFFTKLYNRRLKYSNEKLEEIVKERTENLEQKKNELIEQQGQIIKQQKELIQKNTDLTETQKALTSSEIQHLELKKSQMQLDLDLKAKQLTTHTLHLVEKNQFLLEISKKLETLAKAKDNKEATPNIRKLGQQIKHSIKNDNHWENFRLYFEQVHADFYTKLKLAYPNLTANDLKQCALVKLNLSLDDSATLLGVSSESVRISRYRIQKKMSLTSQANFYDFLMKS
jgi:AraC family chitin signaling transcriptional activator